MTNKLTAAIIADIIALDSKFKDDDSHMNLVETVARDIYKNIKPFTYCTYDVMPSIVVNGLADDVYESIHLTITLKDKVSDLYQIKAIMDFNKNENASLISKITNLQQ